MIFYVYAAYLLLLSLISFVLYFLDKRKAQKGAWRISEKALLLASFLGGAYGGFAAMQIFRHKTTREHWYFTLVNVVGLVIHTSLAIYLAFTFLG